MRTHYHKIIVLLCSIFIFVGCAEPDSAQSPVIETGVEDTVGGNILDSAASDVMEEDTGSLLPRGKDVIGEETDASTEDVGLSDVDETKTDVSTLGDVDTEEDAEEFDAEEDSELEGSLDVDESDSTETNGDVSDGVEDDVEESDGDGEDAESGDTDIVEVLPCEPALQVAPALVYLEPYELILFQASGGTGDYRFSFSDGFGEEGESATGGIVNSITGAYLAGPEVGATDFVRVTDEGCTGVAEAQVIVAEPLELEPLFVTCEPGTVFEFEVSGGSGYFSYSGVDLQSGGSVTAAGEYVAGNTYGIDTVLVEDTATGETQMATVSVSESAPISPQPPYLAMPVGSAGTIVVNGGSGSFDVIVEGVPEVSWDGEAISGEQSGAVSVKVVDAYTGAESQVAVTVADSLEYSIQRNGENQVSGDLLSGFDINGDGLEDFVVSAWNQALSLQEFVLGSLPVLQESVHQALFPHRWRPVHGHLL